MSCYYLRIGCICISPWYTFDTLSWSTVVYTCIEIVNMLMCYIFFSYSRERPVIIQHFDNNAVRLLKYCGKTGNAHFLHEKLVCAFLTFMYDRTCTLGVLSKVVAFILICVFCEKCYNTNEICHIYRRSHGLCLADKTLITCLIVNK